MTTATGSCDEGSFHYDAAIMSLGVVTVMMTMLGDCVCYGWSVGAADRRYEGLFGIGDLGVALA